MRKIISICLLTLSFAAVAVHAQVPKVGTKDLSRLAGAQWTGNLIYLDYGKNKKVSIPSNLMVAPSKDDKRAWIFEFRYPDEPKANSTDTVKLENDGKIFDGETVVERTALADKSLRIVTEKKGRDNDRPATLRHVYLISKNAFSITKQVKYEGTSDFFVRNEYSWTR